MKFLQCILVFINVREVELYFIKNKNVQKCSDCKFFIANKKECGNFGVVDMVTSKTTFEYAIDVRNDETKCGENAIFFKKNKFKFITAPYYFYLENESRINFYFIAASYCFVFVFLITR